MSKYAHATSDRPTDFLLEGLLSLHVVLFKLIIEFLERLQIFDSDSHFFNFLDEQSVSTVIVVRVRVGAVPLAS